MSVLGDYLRSLRDIHGTGTAVAETSYYGALEAALNAAGAGLRPVVRCVLHPGNKGAGLPDGGFFTQEQMRSSEGGRPNVATLPARGVIEVKGVKDSVDAIVQTEQVGRYLALYGQVLVTNYREFLLVTRGANHAPCLEERYRLAQGETELWQKAAGWAGVTADEDEGFCDYLRRVMLRPAPLSAPADLAAYLAAYAREARREAREFTAIARRIAALLSLLSELDANYASLFD